MFKRIKEYFTRIEYRDKDANITDLTRENLKGITIDIIKDSYVGMEEKEKKELCANAENIRVNKSFEFICDRLINLQAEEITKKAVNMEQVGFGRGTINGITILKEEIERLANIYRDDNQKPEDFNKYDILGEE